MHSFNNTRFFPYNIEFIKKIILDIEKYPEFVPWCTKAQLLSKIENELMAELTITFKFFTENYTSRIITIQNKEYFQINIEAVSGPFKKLINLWSIKTVNNGCTVDFSIDFECKSMILNNTIGLFFPIAVNKIMNAFETRALYISQENKVGVIK